VVREPPADVAQLTTQFIVTHAGAAHHGRHHLVAQEFFQIGFSSQSPA